LANAEREHALQLEAAAGHTLEPPTVAPSGRVESGDRADDILARTLQTPGVSAISYLELALALEYAALDLYENLAAWSEDPGLRSSFEALAATERGHVRAVLNAFGRLR